MTTYFDQIVDRYNAQTNHAYLLHGSTRDLQIGSAGSCSLVDHICQQAAAANLLPVVYRVGIGFTFATTSDRQTYKEITGLADRQQSSAGDFASLVNVASATDDDLPIDAPSAIGLIDLGMRQSTRQVLIVIDRAELIVPASAYDRLSPADKAILSILMALASDRSVQQARNILILVTDALPDLADGVRFASSRFAAIEVMPPDYAERLDICQRVWPRLVDRGVDLQLTPSEFAHATSMLTRQGLMEVLLNARAAGVLTAANVRAVKSAVMSQEYGDVLETLDPLSNGYDAIAGLAQLKTLFDRVISDMLAGNLPDVPAGLLLAGAPGLGKSYFMRAVAGASGLPVINFNVGRLLGSFVGQSERNLERALTAIRAAAPCLVVLDEIETTFPDRASAAPAGDSGIGQRILKRMLEELSNPALRGRVVWIGITNYPDKLDAALARAGRFDLTVAFLPPDQTERAALLAVYATKYDIALPDTETINSVAAGLAGYTNAEIENVARKARALIAAGDLSVAACWQAAPTRVRANTRDVQSMTVSALRAVNDSDLLPAAYVDQWRRLTGQTETQQAAPAGSANANRDLF